MDPSRCACLLGDVSNLKLNFAAVQETHFTCATDCRVLEEGYIVHSACGGVGVSLLVGRGLDADVNLFLADGRSRLVVSDVAVESFEFRVVAVCAPSVAAERVSFFRRLAPFLDDTKREVLVGDWNAIPDPKIGSEEELVGREGVKAT